MIRIKFHGCISAPPPEYWTIELADANFGATGFRGRDAPREWVYASV